MSTTYKKNYLKQVIYRLDFPSIDLGSFEDFKQNAPQAEYVYSIDSQKMGSFTFNFSEDEVSKTQDEVTIWRAETKQNDMRFEATNQYCLLEYAQYVNSAKLKEDSNNFISAFLTMHGIEEISRVGLRYVNQISVPSIKKFTDWKKYIASELLSGSLHVKEKLGAPLRYLNQIEINSNASSVVSTSFKYGVWNDKYPSPITAAEYILDIDCFTRTPAQSTDLNITYDSLNKAAEEVFETSIQEPLRKEMNK